MLGGWLVAVVVVVVSMEVVVDAAAQVVAGGYRSWPVPWQRLLVIQV